MFKSINFNYLLILKFIKCRNFKNILLNNIILNLKFLIDISYKKKTIINELL